MYMLYVWNVSLIGYYRFLHIWSLSWLRWSCRNGHSISSWMCHRHEDVVQVHSSHSVTLLVTVRLMTGRAVWSCRSQLKRSLLCTYDFLLRSDLLLFVVFKNEFNITWLVRSLCWNSWLNISQVRLPAILSCEMTRQCHVVYMHVALTDGWWCCVAGKVIVCPV